MKTNLEIIYSITHCKQTALRVMSALHREGRLKPTPQPRDTMTITESMQHLHDAGADLRRAMSAIPRETTELSFNLGMEKHRESLSNIYNDEFNALKLQQSDDGVSAVDYLNKNLTEEG